MATAPADTTLTHKEVAELADRLADVYATYRGADELFAPNAFFDLNVPSWRLQLGGAEAFTSWLRGHSPEGYAITLLQVVPTASGFAAELEGEYTPGGDDRYFRNLVLCEVADGRITEVTFYCTGDWDAETRARQAAEALMIRRGIAGQRDSREGAA
jgi:hypothetical protein